MLVLTKSILALMVSFIFSIIVGLILIPILKKMNIKQNISIYLKDKHETKNGTPTMGGLIFIIPTILSTMFLIFLGKMEFNENLFIVMFVFAAYGLLGFIDDFLSIRRHKNEGLTEIQKIVGQLLIAIFFFYIFLKSGGQPVLDIHTLNITINMGWLYGLFILFMLVSSTNAVNITDGLDGLAGGLSLIAFIAFGIISWGSTWVLGHQTIALFCFILVGSLMGFLFFNAHPAKVFMGDTGSLSLGGTLATIAILTSHEITFVIIAGVFVIEIASALIQIISIKYFKKKVFLMAPLHHHFEKLGWCEQDIVRLFYFVGLVLAMASIVFGVWI